MKYKVKLRVAYCGTVTVEAENPSKAKEIVKNECIFYGGVDSVESPGRAADYEFTSQAIVELGKVNKEVNTEKTV
jgi:hypothetical protein